MKALLTLSLFLITSQQVATEIYKSNEHPNLIGNSPVECLRGLMYGIWNRLRNR